jgi:hypothetical protein
MARRSFGANAAANAGADAVRSITRHSDNGIFFELSDVPTDRIYASTNYPTLAEEFSTVFMFAEAAMKYPAAHTDQYIAQYDALLSKLRSVV